jgi:hypothetical protein
MTISTLLEYLNFHYEKTDMGYKLFDDTGYYHFDYLAETPEDLIHFIPEPTIHDAFLRGEVYGIDKDFDTLEEALEFVKEDDCEWYGELIKVLVNPDLLDKEE